MDYLEFLTITASVCSIVGFLITLFSMNSWGKRILWAIVIFLLTFSGGYAVNRNSENERIKNIHRQANAICEHYSSSYSDEFIQESLAFLEENRDRYPDSYGRAQQIYAEMNNSVVQYDFEAARKLYGIVKGIATLNDKNSTLHH